MGQKKGIRENGELWNKEWVLVGNYVSIFVCQLKQRSDKGNRDGVDQKSLSALPSNCVHLKLFYNIKVHLFFKKYSKAYNCKFPFPRSSSIGETNQCIGGQQRFPGGRAVEGSLRAAGSEESASAPGRCFLECYKCKTASSCFLSSDVCS